MKSIPIKICGCNESSLYQKMYNLKYIDQKIRLNVNELYIQFKKSRGHAKRVKTKIKAKIDESGNQLESWFLEDY